MPVEHVIAKNESITWFCILEHNNIMISLRVYDMPNNCIFVSSPEVHNSITCVQWPIYGKGAQMYFNAPSTM